MTPPTAQVDSPPAHRWGFGAFVLAELVLVLSAVFLVAAAGPVAGEPIPPVVIVVVTALPTIIQFFRSHGYRFIVL